MANRMLTEARRLPDRNEGSGRETRDLANRKTGGSPIEVRGLANRGDVLGQPARSFGTIEVTDWVGQGGPGPKH